MRIHIAHKINNLSWWCRENNLLLNVSKTKELIVDLEKTKESQNSLVNLYRGAVESWPDTLWIGMVCAWPRTGGPQQVIKSSQNIIGTIHWTSVLRQVQRILKYNIYPSSSLLTLPHRPYRSNTDAKKVFHIWNYKKKWKWVSHYDLILTNHND